MTIDVGKLIEYEQGDLSAFDTVKLFQELINDGSAWSLQGHYGRTAKTLLDADLCTPSGEPDLTDGEIFETFECFE